jgi:hypothetical protein
MAAILETKSLQGWDGPSDWAGMSEKQLTVLPRELLEQVVLKLRAQSPQRPWIGLCRRIEHLLKSQAHTAERNRWLAELEAQPLAHRLQSASESRWSMTYFPDSWAIQCVEDASVLSADLKSRLSSKLSRLRRRSPWRDFRKLTTS